MKIAILGPGQKAMGYTTKRLIEEAKKVFKKVDTVPLIDIKLKIDKEIDAIYNKKSISEWDYALLKIDSKRSNIGYPIVKFLEDMGVKKQYPAETVILAHNKFLTLEQLSRNGIPVPKTYMTGSKRSAKEIIARQKLPTIMKLLGGFGGQGVIFLESREAANTVAETMKTLKQEILIEEYIENPGEDIRGIVAGEEVIASYKRIAAKGEKRANIHAGGRAEAFKLTDEMQEIVLKSANAMKMDMGAVDMLQNRKGDIYVTEVNINPGIQAIEKVTNLNVAQRMIEYVKTQIKR